MPLYFGSLFAGIGGIDLGLERAGMKCLWQVEINDYCTKVLEKHWPKVKRFRDIKECGKHNLKSVDLICGGFPCQPHSVAGKRLGAADTRNLWPDFLRIISELRPRWVIGENVKGIITTYLDTVLSDLEGEDYTCWTFNIPACTFGAPHRRERIFIMAHSKQQGLERGIGWAEPILFETNYISTPPLWAHWPIDIPKPFISRGDDGFSSRVDRLKCLGNAVVPQVAEWIGRQVVEADKR